MKNLIPLLLLISATNALAHTGHKNDDKKQSPAPAIVTNKADIVSTGTRTITTLDGVIFKVLLEPSNLNDEPVELVEVTIPSGFASGNHRHSNGEFIYVLSGELQHKVNGQTVLLKAGDVGIVPNNAEVDHVAVSKEPVKALVIWVPGGEAERIFGVNPAKK